CDALYCVRARRKRTRLNFGNRFVDSAVRLQPCDIALLRMLVDGLEKFDGFRLVAWLARIVEWDDGFDFDSDNKAVRADQPGSFYAMAGNAHGF
ncbi:MAG: hypothetical protein WD851_17750, partial [Pirellulales bacterium]